MNTIDQIKARYRVADPFWLAVIQFITGLLVPSGALGMLLLYSACKTMEIAEDQ